jgi:SAM-dependent methyltransferase
MFRRVRIALDRLGNLGRTIDFGCGNGVATELIALRATEVVGFEVVPEYLGEAPPLANVRWVLYDGLAVPAEAETFDTCVCFEVLEHTDDDERSMAEIARVLRPGGRVFLTLPNRWWVFETHGCRLPGPWHRVPFFSWLPKPLHDRFALARIYSLPDTRRVAQRAGLDVLASGYVTAAMDEARPAWLQRFLRRTLFRPDTTRCPFLAVSCWVLARKAPAVP